MKNCIACGGKAEKYADVNGVVILKCKRCGMGATLNPQVQKGRYHRDEVYINETSQFRNIFSRRVKLVTAFKKNPGKILDIGSSTGAMLDLFKKRGWEVLGIEPSSISADYAISRGVKTIKEKFEKANLEKNSFDAVVLNHTLEHLPDPEGVLSRIHKVLKNGGILLIDVPNFGSLSSKIYKGKWPYLLENEHLWHFNEKSLRKILEKNGFRVLKTTMPSGIWDYGSPVKELFSAFFGFKKRFFSDILTLIPSFILSILKKGTCLTVVAKKVKLK